MIFKRNEYGRGVGLVIGFVSGYFLFTTILFFVLDLLGKIPLSWSYLHIMGITLALSLLGTVLKRMLYGTKVIF